MFIETFPNGFAPKDGYFECHIHRSSTIPYNASHVKVKGYTSDYDGFFTTRATDQDFISFSSFPDFNCSILSKLCERISVTVSNILQIPPNSNSASIGYARNSLGSKRIECGFYVIPARKFREFFDAIKDLQRDDASFTVPQKFFNEIINSLQSEPLSTDFFSEETPSTTLSTTIEGLRKSVRTAPFQEEYEADALKSTSAQKAFSLAHYYLKQKDQVSAFSWFCRAVHYLKGAPIPEAVNAQAFLQSLDSLSANAFLECDLDVISPLFAQIKPPKQLGLFLSDLTGKQRATTLMQQANAFLTQTDVVTSIKIAMLSMRAQLNAEYLAPLLTTLETDTHIEKITFENFNIEETALRNLVAALRKNPDSKVKEVVLRHCAENPACAELQAYLKDKNATCSIM